MIHRMATFEVKRESLDAARAALAAYADEVGRKEGGTAFFHAYQEAATPTRFVILMAFRVANAATYHDGTPWAKKFHGAIAPLCSRPWEVRDLAAVTGG